MAARNISPAPLGPAPSRPYPMAKAGYGKRSMPDQVPRRADDFTLLPVRERYVAGFIDHLPDGAAMDVKSLARQLPLYGQQAVGSALKALAAAGYLRRVRCLVGEPGQVRWVSRTFWTRTARDNEWWAAAETVRRTATATPTASPVPPPAASGAAASAAHGVPGADGPEPEPVHGPVPVPEPGPPHEPVPVRHPEPPTTGAAAHAPVGAPATTHVPAAPPAPATTHVPAAPPAPAPAPPPAVPQQRTTDRPPAHPPAPASAAAPAPASAPAPPTPPAPAHGPATAGPSPAYLALAMLGRADSRLTLSAADCAALEARAGEWLARGVSTDYLTQALTAGLPAQVDSPVGFLRRRLDTKIPPHVPAVRPSPPAAGAPVHRVMLECVRCGVPGRSEALPDGLCRPCRRPEADAPTAPGAGEGPVGLPAERDVRAYVAELRELLKAP
ncbi:MarR family transcriptional regulator [Streptomyces sp. NPDC005899]|uniref:MarR family transcriptional regulator n=1 Tax=Streptomyces sp. NPDC005899 TaxID=3155716 RepID=UPI0033F9E7F5